MTTFNEAIHTAKKACEKENIPAETAMSYLFEIANMEKYNLYMHLDEQMPKELYNEFQSGLERILKHEPLAHVLGYSWFYGYKFKINEDVLIPRYETEELVAQILARKDQYFKDQQVTAIDVGTGSGAIAISLKKEEDSIGMYASDISAKAIEVAKENAINNEVKVEFMVGDMLEPFIERQMKVDILISNPPYIPSGEDLETEVVDHEPHVALFGGIDGMDFYRIIFKNCHKLLKEKSFMAFEIGYNQFPTLEKEIKKYCPEATYEIVKDINGKNRMLFVYFNLA